MLSIATGRKRPILKQRSLKLIESLGKFESSCVFIYSPRNDPTLANASDPLVENGCSALIYACRARNHPCFSGVRLRSGPSFEVINLLLHYGANPNARNSDNRTALHYACRNEPKSSASIWHLDEKKNMLKVVKKLIRLAFSLKLSLKILSRAGGDLRLHDKDGLLPIDQTMRLDPRSKFRQEMLSFLTKQQESFSSFQQTRRKDELGTPHRVKLTEKKTKPARGIFGKQPGYGKFFTECSMMPVLQSLTKSQLTLKVYSRVTISLDFNLEQPRIKQTGFGAVIDHVGGAISAFGEAAAIPFADWDQLVDPREQLLRFRVLKLGFLNFISVYLCFVLNHNCRNFDSQVEVYHVSKDVAHFSRFCTCTGKYCEGGRQTLSN